MLLVVLAATIAITLGVLPGMRRLPHTRSSSDKASTEEPQQLGLEPVLANGGTGQQTLSDATTILPLGALPETPQLQLDFYMRWPERGVSPCPVHRIELLSDNPPWGCIYNVQGKTALRIAVGDRDNLDACQLKVGQRYEFRRYKGFFVVPSVARGEVKRIPLILEVKP
jgi:hypothetical protein